MNRFFLRWNLGEYKVSKPNIPSMEVVDAETFDESLAVLESTYLALLKHPHDEWRISNQGVLCELRNFISKATGREAEDVQNEFEAKARSQS